LGLLPQSSNSFLQGGLFRPAWLNGQDERDSTVNPLPIDATLIEDLHRVGVRHYGRLFAFVLLYGAAGYGAFWLADRYPADGLALAARLPLYLLAAASLHGISLFTHEGVHGLLSHNRAWNRALSIACALPVLQNFSAYRVLHLRHHRHLGLPGDPDHYPNYTHWSWLVFAMNWGRLLLGYPAYITAIPLLGFRQGDILDRLWIALEVALLVLLAVVVLASPLSGSLLIHAWLIPMLIINTLVNVRGMSQHTLLEHESDPVRGTRSILTNRITAFFMCNENYHLEHHLYPGVPWYNLPRLHAALKDELIALGAPFIPSYWAFVREFIRGSLRRSPLGRADRRD
jgi:fatty acid desaturase